MKRRDFLVAGSAIAVVGAYAGPLEAKKDGFTTDGRVALNAYRGLVEEHLAGVLHALKALAATSDAQSGEWERIKPALTELAEDVSTEAAFWFAKPDGGYHATAGDLGEGNLKDRSYFTGLMAGKPVEGSAVISKSTGHRSVIVAAPVKKDGAVVAALGASLRARLISELVGKRTALPDGLVFYALDANGQAVIHKDPDLMFQYPSDIGDASLKAAVAKILSTDEGIVEYTFRGTNRTALFDKSDATGWHFVLAQVRR